MKILAIIPARMGSSRFPGKPLARINGYPMIGHCYERAKLCADLTDCYVATCDKEIYDFIESIGGKVVMTSPHHERASDRAAEALLIIEERHQCKYDVVVMIQGDEPMVTPHMITESIKPIMSDPSVCVVNLMAEIVDDIEFEDPNEVKVVVGKNSDALYFSRAAIPSKAKFDGAIPRLKQVCIIPFTRNFLIEFNAIPETPLEIIESIDMLRILENGKKVRMVLTKEKTWSVDTKEDLKKVEEKMQAN
ncbi:3-deoxy-manno-octulosonate cytidylyltransferase [Alphaproteobacteria bacterium]|nr:3-deoxy-manno-octulosonate cytidylyltransferase [Alphaproteobacteria bacterium]